ncbi:MAG: type IIL restriction-modification enzyme MmeI, partial [Planctomycetaceae bacterium]
MQTPGEFITRWHGSAGAEPANSQSFLKELGALLDVPQPEPTLQDESQNHYVFEKAVSFNNGDGTTSAGRVDLYRRGCFVLESKQGSERKAAEQAALAEVTKQKKYRSGTAAHTPGSFVRLRRLAERQEGFFQWLPHGA